jgi:hypothetical protein
MIFFFGVHCTVYNVVVGNGCSGLVDMELLGVQLPDVGSANLYRAPYPHNFFNKSVKLKF